MIALIAICKDEADIVDVWVRHHLSEGVDRIYVADASQDGTKDILRSFDEVAVIDDTEPYCMQVQWMNKLAEMVANDGAKWIIASDVDEFWYARSGGTIADTLSVCPHDTIYARMYQHLDWDTRFVNHKRMPKVAFRWTPDRVIAMGNHNVTGPTGVYDVLDLRELQFRSFEHYCSKVRARLATLDPATRARGDAGHYVYLENKTDEELRNEWSVMTEIAVVHDPIPTHLSASSSHSLVQNIS